MNGQILVLRLRATLTSVWAKFRGQYTYGGTGLTVVTMRTINKGATASKPLLDQIAVDLGVNLFAWRRNLRSGNAPVHVTARIGRRGVKLDL